MPQTTRTTVNQNQNGQYQTTNSVAVEGIQAASNDAAKRAEIERAKAAVRDRLETGYDQGRPPFGMRFDDTGRYWVPDEEFSTALKVIDLRDAGTRITRSRTGPACPTRRLAGSRNVVSDTIIPDSRCFLVEHVHPLMSFRTSWHTLLEECDALGDGATLTTPQTDKTFRITSVQDPRIVIEFVDTTDSQPLKREQFETLAGRMTDAGGTFELQRLPPDAEPYATVLSLHPRYECNERAGTLTETDEPTTSQLITGASPSPDEQAQDRTEPDLDVYSDMLLLIDALERQNPTALEDCETPALINLYTLLSDVQRNTSDLRTAVREVLLERLHHDQPVHGQYGSVQRTSRRNRSLKDDDEVIGVLEDAGIARERILTVDREKVDEALDVTELSESDVYEIEKSEYVRKADVDEERKETRLQGLKDQLALSDDPNAEELRQEVAGLEQRIEELTAFNPGTEVGSQS